MNASSKPICFDMLQNKILWRLSFKTQLEDWVFILSTGHENCLDKSLNKDIVEKALEQRKIKK